MPVCSPHILFRTLIESTPTIKFSILSKILSLKMPSYKTLAVLALAASTASPALSAPVPYGRLYL